MTDNHKLIRNSTTEFLILVHKTLKKRLKNGK